MEKGQLCTTERSLGEEGWEHTADPERQPCRGGGAVKGTQGSPRPHPHSPGSAQMSPQSHLQEHPGQEQLLLTHTEF